MKQGETKFKERALKDLKKEFGDDCVPLKTQERGRRGVPDLIMCLRGSYVAIELKVDGAKPEPIQAVYLERVRKARGLAFSSTPSQWALHLKMLREYVRA